LNKVSDAGRVDCRAFHAGFVGNHSLAIKKQKGAIERFLISVLVILGFYFCIDFFHDRVNSIYHEISSWLNKTNIDTSTGLRLSMWQISWILIKQAPFCGYGDLGYQSQL